MHVAFLIFGFLGVAVWKHHEEEARRKEAIEAQRRAEEARLQAEAERAQDEQVRVLVKAVLHKIARAFNIRVPEVVFTNAIGNAASDGGRILVNPAWFRVLLGAACTNPTCNRTVARGILAHEMTHHVHGDAFVPLPFRNHHGQELRADFYAGRVLALFGDDLAALERVLRAISPQGALTHPAFPARIHAAREGYRYQVAQGAVAEA